MHCRLSHHPQSPLGAAHWGLPLASYCQPQLHLNVSLMPMQHPPQTCHHQNGTHYYFAAAPFPGRPVVRPHWLLLCLRSGVVVTKQQQRLWVSVFVGVDAAGAGVRLPLLVAWCCVLLCAAMQVRVLVCELW